jgi:hypothetical protein
MASRAEEISENRGIVARYSGSRLDLVCIARKLSTGEIALPRFDWEDDCLAEYLLVNDGPGVMTLLNIWL